MKKIFLVLMMAFILPFPQIANAKVLDKILAVIDDHIITLSTVKRIKETLNARREISGFIYKKDKYNNKEVVDIIIHNFLIRDKLSELGYIITDEQVDSNIKSTESRLGIQRAELLRFLESKSMTFDEYYELSRESIEHNFFGSRIIQPLISTTEQEIKNTFYNMNSENTTLSFKYSLVDFSMGKNKFSKGMLKKFKNILTKFQSTGNLPQTFKTVATNVIEDIGEDSLAKNLKTELKKTNEGSFSNPILIGSEYHIFYIKTKDLVESELYLKAKNQIRAIIFEKEEGKIKKLWYQRESNKHYIKYFI